MSEALYLKDSYIKEWEAVVKEVNQDKYIVLDKTAFYPSGGGQPHDTGTMEANGTVYNVIYVTKIQAKFDSRPGFIDSSRQPTNESVISHELNKPGFKPGDKVKCSVDWERRYKLMRMHTAAHIIDAVLYREAGALCTGNQLGVDKSRIDFSLESIDKEKMQEYIALANNLAKKNINVKIYFMKREEALKIPGVVKLASVMPPEIEELRIVEIPGVDLQADGGTQVKNTSEIGEIRLLSMENKGKSNRRVYYTVE